MRYLTLFVLILYTNYGVCCTCGPMRTVEDQFKHSEIIVVGTIIEKDPMIQIDSVEYNRLINNGLDKTKARRFTSGGYYQYTLALSETAYKGNFLSDTLKIRTGLSGSSCGYSFEIGKKYIVYGYSKNPIPNKPIDKQDEFWTDNCTRTNFFSEKENRKLVRIAKRMIKK